MSDDCFGPNCITCNRVTVESLEVSPTRLITYDGEYAVITGQAPEFDAPGCMAAYRLGVIDHQAYVTMVVYLGAKEASINESRYIVEDADFYRYWVRHNDPLNLEEAHKMVVESFRDGLISVDKSRGDEFKAERDANLTRLHQEAKDAIASGKLGGKFNF